MQYDNQNPQNEDLTSEQVQYTKVIQPTKQRFMTTQELVLAAFAIALSFTLAVLKFKVQAGGGSVTVASTLPIALYAYVFGWKKGLLAGLVFSGLQMLESFAWISILGIILDYTVPFTVIGLAGLLKGLKKHIGHYNFLIMLTIIYIIKFISHTASSLFCYKYEFLPSVLYNVSYVVPDFIIVFAVTLLLLLTKTFGKLILEMEKVAAKSTDF